MAQEALLRAWRMRASCRSPEEPWGWIREITRNEAHRMRSRRAATHELPTESLPEETGGSGEEALLTRVDVERALAHLSPADRMLVRLHYEADMPQTSVAVALGLSVANVKVRLHRLRPKLKENLVSP